MNSDLHPAVGAAARTLKQWYGIDVPRYRLPLLASELVHLSSGGELDSALDRLLAHDQDAWDAVIDAMTVPESYLFRHIGHFVLLRQIVEQRRREGRACRVLSAGCSSGEEAWSAAAVLGDLPSSRRDMVVGWDLNERRLNHAREGRYRDWSARSGLFGYTSHFRREGDEWKVAAHLKPLVRFERVNLVGCLPDRDAPFDAVFFRNVGIYWEEKVARRVAQLLADLTAEDGLVLIGPADPGLSGSDRFEHIIADGVRHYRRRDATEQPGVRPLRGAVQPPLRKCPSAFPPRRSGMLSRDRAPAAPRASVWSPQRRSEAPATLPGLEQVRVLADAGNYGQALAALDAVPGDATAEPRLWRGILLMALERPGDAVASFRQCVFLEPNRAPYRRWLAVAYESSGRMRDAERERRNALHLGLS